MINERSFDLNGLILNTIVTPVFALNAELYCIAWNNSWEAITGIKADHAMDKSIYDLLPGIENTFLVEAFHKVIKTNQPQSLLHSFTFNGTARYYSLELKPIPEGILVAPEELKHDRMQEKSNGTSDLHKMFIEQVPQAIAMLDTNMIYLSASKAWHEMYGFKEDEMIGQCHYDLFPEILDMPEWLEFHRRCLKGETIKKERDFFGRINGQNIWIRWEIKPWFEESGEIGGIIMFSEEVTENVEQFQALESMVNELNKSEALLSSLYENSPLIVTLVDKNHIVHDLNYTFPGMEKSDIVGKSVLDFTENEFHTILKESINLVFETGQTTNYTTYRRCPKAETLCWFENYLGPIYKEDKIEFVSVNAVNITEKVIAEEQRIIATEQFQHVFNNIADLVCLHNPDGTYKNVSPSIKQIAGYDAISMIGKNPYDFFHPDDIQRIIEESHKPMLEQSKKESSIEYRYRHKDGHYLWFLTSTQVIKDQDGQILQLVTSTKDITQNKQLEEERKQQMNEVSAELIELQNATQMAEMGIWIRDFSDNSLHWDESLYKLYGIENSENLDPYEVWTNALHPDDKEFTIRTVADAVESNENGYETVFRIIRPDKEVLYIRAKVKIDRDENGSALRMYGTNWNATKEIITRQERDVFAFENELLIKELKEYQRAAFQAQVGVWHFDPDNGDLRWDENMYKLYGVDEKDFSGAYDAWQNCVHPDDLERAEKELNEAIEGKAPFDTVFRIIQPKTQDVLHIRAKASVNTDGNGEKVIIHGTNWDVSREMRISNERDRMATELEQQLEALDVSSIVSITNPQGEITYVNQEFCKISGYSEAELIGQDHSIINSGYHPPSFFKNMWEELKNGNVWKENICNRAKDGSIYWVRTTIYPFKNAQGEIEKYISVRFNITQMINQAEVLEKQAKQLEEAKKVLSENLEKEMELNELKSRFVATASHQFRTPLTVIQANMGVLTMSSEWINEESKDKFNRISNRITSQITRMTEMMDEVLTLSKIRSGGTPVMKDRFDVVEICQKLIHNFNEIENSDKVEIHISGEPRAIYIDERLFEDAISNFISNGIKYSPKEESVRVELNFTDSALEITISDKGIGIPKKELDRFFEPFFRGTNAKNIEGTGLGTSIAKEYIELLGGNTTVKSEEGKGTEVQIKLNEIIKHELE